MKTKTNKAEWTEKDWEEYRSFPWWGRRVYDFFCMFPWVLRKIGAFYLIRERRWEAETNRKTGFNRDEFREWIEKLGREHEERHKDDKDD